MRRFLPYFKYLRKVRGHLIAGVLCGIIYGAAGGLGMPLMIKYVIPRVLVPDSPAQMQQHVAAPTAKASFFASHFPRLDRFLKACNPDRLLDRWLPPSQQPAPASVSSSTAPPPPTPAAATPPPRPKLSLWQIWAITIWLPIVFLIRGVAGYLNTYLIQYAGVRILEGIRLDYFRKLQSLPLAFFQRLSTGELITRGLSDTNQLQNTLTLISNDLIKQPATLFSTITAVIILAYQEQGLLLVLICLLTVPLAIFPIRYVGKKMVSRALHLQSQAGTVTDRFTENLAGVKEVRAFGLERYEIDRFARLCAELVRANMKVVKYAQALTPSIEVLSAIGISITFVYAYRYGVHSGSFLGILAALYLSYDPIKRLGAVNTELKRGGVSLLRLEEVLQAPVDIADPADPVKVGRLKGNLAYDRVGFSYKAGTPVLRNVSIDIPAGTVCALVGPSGAGKTTFANLVPRFYDVIEGAVTIDGIDLRAMRFADLRRNIALVSQDPVLFNETLYHNLLLGRPEAAREEVVQAAVNAHAHDFIQAFPQGYETLAGERGARLSGGQKQRIAIARAFLRNAPILILDEATNALDAESEAAVQLALKKLMSGKTVLIIAHRFSTIRDATRILVFDRGAIVASGTHNELYAGNPLYRSLYDHQYSQEATVDGA